MLVELLDIVGSGVEGNEGAVWKESGGEVVQSGGLLWGGAGRGGWELNAPRRGKA